MPEFLPLVRLPLFRLPLFRLPLFRLPLAKTKEEKKSSFPLWGNRKEKNGIAFGNTLVPRRGQEKNGKKKSFVSRRETKEEGLTYGKKKGNKKFGD